MAFESTHRSAAHRPSTFSRVRTQDRLFFCVCARVLARALCTREPFFYIILFLSWGTKCGASRDVRGGGSFFAQQRTTFDARVFVRTRSAWLTERRRAPKREAFFWGTLRVQRVRATAGALALALVYDLLYGTRPCYPGFRCRRVTHPHNSPGRGARAFTERYSDVWYTECTQDLCKLVPTDVGQFFSLCIVVACDHGTCTSLYIYRRKI